MPKNGTKGGLHLPKLSISGFRGIRKLEIKRLGRVTLLAGKNGVGKTTVLEAVRIFASRGRKWAAWEDMFHKHDEYLPSRRDDSDKDASRVETAINFKSVFYGRRLSRESAISIGPSPTDQLEVLFRRVRSNRPLGRDARLPFVVRYGGDEYQIPVSPRDRHAWWLDDDEDDYGPALLKSSALIKCRALGPELLHNNEVANLWDEVVLTEIEEKVVEALRLVCGADLERIAIISVEEESRHRRLSRVAMVKFKGDNDPVPLRSLGDGAVRIFGLTLALIENRDGFLLIDEAENGIHHSVQAEIWRLLLRSAKQNNVQVIATTHGWDCVEKFAEVAFDEEDVEGRLVRLERKKDGILRTVEYSEEELVSATRHDFEVR